MTDSNTNNKAQSKISSLLQPLTKAWRAPLTQKRWQRFKSHKRAFASLWLFLLLYVLSLGADFIANDHPLYVNCNGSSYFPALANLGGRSYAEDIFIGSGYDTRPNYHEVATNTTFTSNPDNWMLFPVVPYGPYASENPDRIDIDKTITVKALPLPALASINLRPDLTISRASAAGSLFGTNDSAVKDLSLDHYFTLEDDLKEAIQARFANQTASSVTRTVHSIDGTLTATASLRAHTPRSAPPKTVRLKIRQETKSQKAITLTFQSPDTPSTDPSSFWSRADAESKLRIQASVTERLTHPIERYNLDISGQYYQIEFLGNDVLWPYKPTGTHYMGLDKTGRDVFARVIYGMRIAISFGLALVIVTTLVGIVAGAVQGYFGGLVDLFGQRIIEVWSALPFLYIIILMGSLFGQSLTLLLIVYSLFSWIGISYYVRAEFLRLRKQPFVESAICLGLPTRTVIFKHILPNALTPVITLFPFHLVGAISVLAALDYLGFGLPIPTPSWGELLEQARSYRWAWWLVLYPSAALFVTVLLGVFIGEGVREAFDPRKFSEME